MRRGEYSSRHGVLVVVMIFTLGASLLLSVPVTTYASPITQTSETTMNSMSEPILREYAERGWDLASSESRENFQLLQSNFEAQPDIPELETGHVLDVMPFGTPHAPIYIDDNTDFETQGWPGNGTVEQPYIIAGLNINATSTEGTAINITNTDVHFFVKDCWLTSNETSVIELNSVSHGRIVNNTILDSDRGVVALHSDDLTIYDNLFFSFGWAGVYMEDCSLSTLRNNNCTICFVGLHVEQSNNILVEDNYCTGCLGGIEFYLLSESNTIKNNTLTNNDVGIGIYLDCTDNLIDSNNCTMNLVYGIYSQNCQDNDILRNYGRGQIGDIVLENCTSHMISDNDSGETTGAGPEMVASIALYNSNNSIVADNYVENAFICIEMKWGSSYNEILNNTCFYYAGGVVSWYDAQYNTITNNTCDGDGAGEVDIFIEDSSYNLVIENRCNHSMYNIASFESNHTEVVDNLCDFSFEAGIAIMGNYYSLVEGNTLTNGSSGIALDSVMYISVLDNSVTNFTGTWTGGPTGIHLTQAYNSSVEGNYITECNVAIMVDQSRDCNVTDNECIDNFDGIVVFNSCYDIIVDDNYCYLQVGYALVVVESFDCVVSKNTCTNTSGAEGFCLLFGDCSADASENSFSLSTGGIEVQGNDGLITQNIIEDNAQYGITIAGIIGPNVTWNVFENNGVNAIDASDTAMFDYNYWSNYTGADSNADGIGDTWHPIQGAANNNDTHPLVYQPTLPAWFPEPEDRLAELGHAFEYLLSYTTSTDLAPIVDWWISDTTHFFIDNGTVSNIVALDFTVYVLEVRAINLYGFELSGTFTVTVVDTISPIVNGPDDFSITYGVTGHVLNWSLHDVGPANYTVLVDGVVQFSGDWVIDGQVIDVHLDHLNLDVGTHTIEVIVTDVGGNTASDVVIVTVLAPFDMTTFLLVIGAGGAITVLVIVYVLRKKGK